MDNIVDFGISYPNRNNNKNISKLHNNLSLEIDETSTWSKRRRRAIDVSISYMSKNAATETEQRRLSSSSSPPPPHKLDVSSGVDATSPAYQLPQLSRITLPGWRIGVRGAGTRNVLFYLSSYSPWFTSLPTEGPTFDHIELKSSAFYKHFNNISPSCSSFWNASSF